jgi:UDP-glucose 4-epimerase
LDGDALVVLRLTNAVGAPAAPDVARWTLLVNDLCREAALHGTVTLKSAGDQWRDFVPITDVVRIVGRACDPAALPGSTYNLGSGAPMTVRTMASLVQDAFFRLAGSKPELIAPEPVGPAPRPYRVAVTKLASHGLTAGGDIAAAVDETAAFCLEHLESLRHG